MEEKSKDFLFMAFDIEGYSTLEINEMIGRVRTVFKRWADHRCDSMGAQHILYELPIGDELIIAAEKNLKNVVCFLSFISKWRRLMASNKLETRLRFALHAGYASAIAINGILKCDQSLNVDNILGEPINVISRILSVARPTQILASEDFWRVVKSHISSGELSPNDIDSGDTKVCRYDKYSITVKHGEEITVYNLLWDLARTSSDSAKTPFVGHPSPPDAPLGVKFLGENNYHMEVTYGPFFRRSADELFEIYWGSMREEERVFVNNRHFFWRLPYAIVYQQPDIKPLHLDIDLNGADKRGNYTQHEYVERFKRQATHYEENQLAAVSKISWIRRRPKTLKLNRIQYSDVVSTNLMVDMCEKSNNKWITHREYKFSFDNNCFPELGSMSAVLPDNLGVTSVIITSDHRLFHPWRSDLVHSHPSTYTAGASGAVDWKDIDDQELKNTDIEGYEIKKQYLAHAAGRKLVPLEWPAVREVLTEYRVTPAEIRKVYFLGIGRELLRLAKPDFFFVIYVSISAEELKDRRIAAKEYWEHGLEKCPNILPILRPNNDADNRSTVLCEAIRGKEYNPVTRMALYLLSKCSGALDFSKI